MSTANWPPSLLDLYRSTHRGPLAGARPRFARLRDELVPPLDGATIVKIGGTNGKGSVSAMLEAFLLHEGAAAGLFTSPHLVEIHERIRIRGDCVSGRTLEAQARRVLRELERVQRRHGEELRPTFFEALLLIALHCFLDAGIDHLVIEAGLGGYRDATAALPSEVAAITSVGMDHQDVLGPTLEHIARDKAGIATERSCLVLGPQIPGPIAEVIQADCAPRGVEVVRAPRERCIPLAQTIRGTDLELAFADGPVRCRLNLPGQHQVSNLATAVGVLERMRPARRIAAGAAAFGAVSWPGRMQYVEGRPGLLLDVAHNRPGLEALGDALDALLPHEDRVLVFGGTEGKDNAGFVEVLPRLAPTIFLVGGYFMGLAVEELASLCRRAGVSHSGTFADVRSALDAILPNVAPHRTVLVTGSLHLVGQVSARLREPTPLHGRRRP